MVFTKLQSCGVSARAVLFPKMATNSEVYLFFSTFLGCHSFSAPTCRFSPRLHLSLVTRLYRFVGIKKVNLDFGSTCEINSSDYCRPKGPEAKMYNLSWPVPALQQVTEDIYATLPPLVFLCPGNKIPKHARQESRISTPCQRGHRAYFRQKAPERDRQKLRRSGCDRRRDNIHCNEQHYVNRR